MGRELKFRVWYEGTQFMDYSPNLLAGHFDDNEVNVNEGIADSGLPWMQYTGLKDSQGREIYEGDIVHYQFLGELSHGGVGVIEFESGCFHVESFFLWDFGGGSSEWLIEVIGNIHENPELLQT